MFSSTPTSLTVSAVVTSPRCDVLGGAREQGAVVARDLASVKSFDQFGTKFDGTMRLWAANAHQTIVPEYPALEAFLRM